jgi:hypothetical protein
MPKPCSEKRVPPAKKHMPRTRTASHVTVHSVNPLAEDVFLITYGDCSVWNQPLANITGQFELSNQVNTAKYRTSRVGAVAVKRENGNRLT